MDKSEFYKLWHTRQEGAVLNEYGFPPVLWLAQPITTEEQWTDFLNLEMEPVEFAKLDKDAADMLGIPFVLPHVLVRKYPEPTDQLDGIYKALLAIKESGIDIGTAGTEYLDSITAVKTSVPKTYALPEAPDPTMGVETEVLPEETLPEFPPDYEPPA
jgi:hypothetical protein